MRAPITVAVLTGNTVFCTVMGIAYGDHAFDPPSALWPWITAHGLGACVGAFIGYATSTTVRTSQVLKNNPVQTTPPPPPQEK
jgi:uncharacterized membrane protein YfcA